MTKLYGIGGYLRSGKDAFADRLVEKHDFVKLNMSNPLVDVARIQNVWIRLDHAIDLKAGKTGSYHAPKNSFIRVNTLLDGVGYTEAKKQKEFRDYLQVMGTQVGRNLFGDNVWTEIARENIRKARATGKNVVVTGIRFQNELDMIFDEGGTTIWISRPDTAPLPGGHASETSLSVSDFERVVQNDGTLEELLALADIFHQALTYSH